MGYIDIKSDNPAIPIIKNIDVRVDKDSGGFIFIEDNTHIMNENILPSNSFLNDQFYYLGSNYSNGSINEKFLFIQYRNNDINIFGSGTKNLNSTDLPILLGTVNNSELDIRNKNFLYNILNPLEFGFTVNNEQGTEADNLIRLPQLNERNVYKDNNLVIPPARLRQHHTDNFPLTRNSVDTDIDNDYVIAANQPRLVPRAADNPGTIYQQNFNHYELDLHVETKTGIIDMHKIIDFSRRSWKIYVNKWSGGSFDGGNINFTIDNTSAVYDSIWNFYEPLESHKQLVFIGVDQDTSLFVYAVRVKRRNSTNSFENLIFVTNIDEFENQNNVEIKQNFVHVGYASDNNLLCDDDHKISRNSILLSCEKQINNEIKAPVIFEDKITTGLKDDWWKLDNDDQFMFNNHIRNNVVRPFGSAIEQGNTEFNLKGAKHRISTNKDEYFMINKRNFDSRNNSYAEDWLGTNNIQTSLEYLFYFGQNVNLRTVEFSRQIIDFIKNERWNYQSFTKYTKQLKEIIEFCNLGLIKEAKNAFDATEKRVLIGYKIYKLQIDAEAQANVRSGSLTKYQDFYFKSEEKPLNAYLGHFGAIDDNYIQPIKLSDKHHVEDGRKMFDDIYSRDNNYKGIEKIGVANKNVSERFDIIKLKFSKYYYVNKIGVQSNGITPAEQEIALNRYSGMVYLPKNVFDIHDKYYYGYIGIDIKTGKHIYYVYNCYISCIDLLESNDLLTIRDPKNKLINFGIIKDANFFPAINKFNIDVLKAKKYRELDISDFSPEVATKITNCQTIKKTNTNDFYFSKRIISGNYIYLNIDNSLGDFPDTHPYNSFATRTWKIIFDEDSMIKTVKHDTMSHIFLVNNYKDPVEFLYMDGVHKHIPFEEVLLYIGTDESTKLKLYVSVFNRLIYVFDKDVYTPFGFATNTFDGFQVAKNQIINGKHVQSFDDFISEKILLLPNNNNLIPAVQRALIPDPIRHDDPLSAQTSDLLKKWFQESFLETYNNQNLYSSSNGELINLQGELNNSEITSIFNNTESKGLFSNREQLLVFSDNNHLIPDSDNYKKYLVNENHFGKFGDKEALKTFNLSYQTRHSILYINPKKSYLFYGAPSADNGFNTLLPNEICGHEGFSKDVIADLINSVAGIVKNTEKNSKFHNWNFSSIINFHIILGYYESLPTNQLARYFTNYLLTDLPAATEYNNFTAFKNFMWNKLFVNNPDRYTKEIITSFLDESHGDYHLQNNNLIVFNSLPKIAGRDNASSLEMMYRNEFLAITSVKSASDRFDMGKMKNAYHKQILRNTSLGCFNGTSEDWKFQYHDHGTYSLAEDFTVSARLREDWINSECHWIWTMDDIKDQTNGPVKRYFITDKYVGYHVTTNNKIYGRNMTLVYIGRDVTNGKYAFADSKLGIVNDPDALMNNEFTTYSVYLSDELPLANRFIDDNMFSHFSLERADNYNGVILVNPGAPPIFQNRVIDPDPILNFRFDNFTQQFNFPHEKIYHQNFKNNLEPSAIEIQEKIFNARNNLLLTVSVNSDYVSPHQVISSGDDDTLWAIKDNVNCGKIIEIPDDKFDEYLVYNNNNKYITDCITKVVDNNGALTVPSTKVKLLLLGTDATTNLEVYVLTGAGNNQLLFIKDPSLKISFIHVGRIKNHTQDPKSPFNGNKIIDNVVLSKYIESQQNYEWESNVPLSTEKVKKTINLITQVDNDQYAETIIKDRNITIFQAINYLDNNLISPKLLIKYGPTNPQQELAINPAGHVGRDNIIEHIVPQLDPANAWHTQNYSYLNDFREFMYKSCNSTYSRPLMNSVIINGVDVRALNHKINTLINNQLQPLLVAPNFLSPESLMRDVNIILDVESLSATEHYWVNQVVANCQNASNMHQRIFNGQPSPFNIDNNRINRLRVIEATCRANKQNGIALKNYDNVAAHEYFNNNIVNFGGGVAPNPNPGHTTDGVSLWHKISTQHSSTMLLTRAFDNNSPFHIAINSYDILLNPEYRNDYIDLFKGTSTITHMKVNTFVDRSVGSFLYIDNFNSNLVPGVNNYFIYLGKNLNTKDEFLFTRFDIKTGLWAIYSHPKLNFKFMSYENYDKIKLIGWISHSDNYPLPKITENGTPEEFFATVNRVAQMHRNAKVIHYSDYDKIPAEIGNGRPVGIKKLQDNTCYFDFVINIRSINHNLIPDYKALNSFSRIVRVYLDFTGKNPDDELKTITFRNEKFTYIGIDTASHNEVYINSQFNNDIYLLNRNIPESDDNYLLKIGTIDVRESNISYSETIDSFLTKDELFKKYIRTGRDSGFIINPIFGTCDRRVTNYNDLFHFRNNYSDNFNADFFDSIKTCSGPKFFLNQFEGVLLGEDNYFDTFGKMPIKADNTILSSEEMFNIMMAKEESIMKEFNNRQVLGNTGLSNSLFENNAAWADPIYKNELQNQFFTHGIFTTDALVADSTRFPEIATHPLYNNTLVNSRNFDTFFASQKNFELENNNLNGEAAHNNLKEYSDIQGFFKSNEHLSNSAIIEQINNMFGHDNKASYDAMIIGYHYPDSLLVLNNRCNIMKIARNSNSLRFVISSSSKLNNLPTGETNEVFTTSNQFMIIDDGNIIKKFNTLIYLGQNIKTGKHIFISFIRGEERTFIFESERYGFNSHFENSNPKYIGKVDFVKKDANVDNNNLLLVDNLRPNNNPILQLSKDPSFIQDISLQYQKHNIHDNVLYLDVLMAKVDNKHLIDASFLEIYHRPQIRNLKQRFLFKARINSKDSGNVVINDAAGRPEHILLGQDIQTNCNLYLSRTISPSHESFLTLSVEIYNHGFSRLHTIGVIVNGLFYPDESRRLFSVGNIPTQKNIQEEYIRQSTFNKMIMERRNVPNIIVKKPIASIATDDTFEKNIKSLDYLQHLRLVNSMSFKDQNAIDLVNHHADNALNRASRIHAVNKRNGGSYLVNLITGFKNNNVNDQDINDYINEKQSESKIRSSAFFDLTKKNDKAVKITENLFSAYNMDFYDENNVYDYKTLFNERELINNNFHSEHEIITHALPIDKHIIFHNYKTLYYVGTDSIDFKNKYFINLDFTVAHPRITIFRVTFDLNGNYEIYKDSSIVGSLVVGVDPGKNH